MRPSKKVSSIQAILTARDTDEVFDRLKSIDLEILKFAQAIYQGYQRLNKRTKTSLQYYCYLLAFQSHTRSPSYIQNWYNIYRHFCVRCKLRIEDLIGLDYRMMKFIAESKRGIFTAELTRDTVARLKDPTAVIQQKWIFIKNRKTGSKINFQY